MDQDHYSRKLLRSFLYALVSSANQSQQQGMYIMKATYAEKIMII
jgi:hypothetical protein